jgi:hypothetical protein
MKAIETVYRGYRFRSRLEARWAVFFDVLDIEWEYEKEGFDLGGGELYLPDFYLPNFDCYIEIKPTDPISEHGWRYNDNRLMKFSEEKLLIVFYSVPGKNYGCWYGNDSCDSGGGESMWSCMEWCYDRENGLARITTNNGRNDRVYWMPDWSTTADIIVGYSEDEDWGISKTHPFLTEAYTKAKQARFEHGRKG